MASVTTNSRITGISLTEEKYVRTERFALIASGTSGSVALPPDSQVILDDYQGLVDAYISATSGGIPTFTNALDGSSMVVATSFDVGGNFVLTSAPASYPVAIIYKVRQKLKDLDSDSTNIIDGVDFVGGGIPSGGSTGQSLTKNSGNDYDAGWTTVSGGGGGGGATGIKSGLVSNSSFSGNPKTCAVTFSTPFSDSNYSIDISGVDQRSWSYASKSAGGFTIDANANTALTGEVSWTAIVTGEQ